MAGKYLELAFKLSGETDKSLGSAFKNLKVDMEGLNKKIASLEKSRGDVKRFEGLRKDVLKTLQEFNKAKKSTEELAIKFNDASKKSKELRDEYDRAQKTVSKLAKEMDAATNPTDELKNKFKEAQETLDRLEKEVKEADRSTKNLKKEYEDAQKKTTSLNKKYEEQIGKYKELKTSMNEAGISTKNLTKDQAELEKSLNRLAKAQANYNKSRDKLDTAKAQTAEARGRLVDAAAMGATVLVPAKLAMDAEETMADINKVADFDSDEELMEMQKKIMEMNTKGKIPMSFNELGQIVASGAQAGLDKLELPRFASDAAKLGIAIDVEAEEAGQIMAGWRSAFDMNQDEVINLADKVNYLGNTTAASAPKISDFVTRVGAMGEVGGVQSGEIAALGATLIGMNIPAEVAATATNKLISTLNKGESATDRQQAVFKKLGFNATEMAKRMQTDAKGAIVDVMKALDQLPDYERAASLNDLFGETGTKAVAPLLNNIRQLEENLAKVDETQKLFAGSMEAEFEARIETTSNSVQILKNQMENMGITLGSVLLPPIVDLATMVGGLAFKIQEFADKYPNLTRGIVMATAAFLALNVAIIAGVYAGRVLKQSYLSVGHAFSKLKLLWAEGKIQAIGQTIATKAMSAAQLAQTGISKLAAGAQWALNAAMNANPIALVIAAIAALIAIGVALYKNWDMVQQKLGQLWNWFSEKFPGMAEFAEKAGATIKNTFGKAIEWVSGKVEWLGNAWDKTVGRLFKSKKGSSKGGGNIPAYATGGIVNSPQIALIGEGGVSEAIIPLEKTANSISLWEKAGRALGIDMTPKGIDIASGAINSKGSTVNNNDGDKYEFNFNIDAKGAGPGVEDAIRDKLIQEVVPIIIRALEGKKKDKLRVKIS